MERVVEIPIAPRPPGPFEGVVGAEKMGSFLAAARWLRARFDGRVLWNVNSTAVGGGVAELLRSLVAYSRGAGIDMRWLVTHGTQEFFTLTKRLHHALHGEPGDGTPLDEGARVLYDKVTRDNAEHLGALVRPGDVVLVHDPQPAGLVPYLLRTGARVIWRCHIGADESNGHVEEGWRFLQPYLEGAHAYVFSREAYIPDFCPRDRTVVIPPSIDPFSPKNQELTPETSRAILSHTGIINGTAPDAVREFLREDGSTGRVDRTAEVLRFGRAPSWDTPLVVQVSRWDPLKDPVGVIEGFAEMTNGRGCVGAELVLAGPEVAGVVDDPESPRVFRQVVDVVRELPEPVRRRVHLARLPLDDIDENAAIVNALQRHATVVVQKSLREGFGLTVAEAMWKSRPVVATATGGILDQLDGDSGILLDDPRDPAGFALAVRQILADASLANELGRMARERVRDHFLQVTALERWGRLVDSLIDGPLS
jgi:trehalose synthase